MKFFEIRKKNESEHQIRYSVILYSAELKREDFMMYLNPVLGCFQFSLSDATVIEYYQTVEDGVPHGKIYFDNLVKYCGVGLPKEFSRNFAAISPIPSFELEYVLKYLLSGGWMQVFRDNRIYSFFFGDAMPDQTQVYYAAEIKCISEDGDCHMEYFNTFARSVQEARTWMLAQSPRRIEELSKSDYKKFIPAFIKGVGDWMMKDMPFLSAYSISEEDFDWNVTSVAAKHMQELCPPLPEEGKNV